MACRLQTSVDTLGDHNDLCGCDSEVLLPVGLGKGSAKLPREGSCSKAVVNLYHYRGIGTKAGVVFLWGAAGLGSERARLDHSLSWRLAAMDQMFDF